MRERKLLIEKGSYVIRGRINGCEYKLKLAASRYSESTAQALFGAVLSLEEAIRQRRGADGYALDLLGRYPEVRSRLAEKGFSFLARETTLSALCDKYERYSESRKKPSTCEEIERFCRRFLDYFDGDRIANDITEEEAANFRVALIERYGLNERSTAGQIAKARALFAYAVEKRIVDANVFLRVKKGSMVNQERNEHIDLATIARLLDACETIEEKALVAFARFEGCRVPSELEDMDWSDIDFDKSQILFHSRKTERHAGHESRITPIFQPARPILEELRERGSLDALRSLLRNRYNRILRACERAGIPSIREPEEGSYKPWERLFQNLRASASNDVAAKFGDRLENLWIGHSAETAKKHYYRTVDEEIANAAALVWK